MESGEPTNRVTASERLRRLSMTSFRNARLVACCALLFVALPAHAQDIDDATRAAARKLGTAGVESYQSGQFQVASEKLEKAYRMLQVPSLGLWSARALVKLGHLVEAQERYVKV